MPQPRKSRLAGKPFTQLHRIAEWYMLRLALSRDHDCLRQYGRWLSRANIPDEFDDLLEEDEPTDMKKLKLLCERRIRKDEGSALRARRYYRERCKPIVSRLGLDELQTDLLIFGVARDSHRGLLEMCDRMHLLGQPEAANALASLFEISTAQVTAALTRGSVLIDCGLLEPSDFCTDLKSIFEVPRYLTRALTGTHPIDQCLLKRTFEECTARRRMDDFPHLHTEIDMIKAVLGGGGRGHVLIAGAPGVGKTELARLIAGELGWAAQEVRCEDSEGDPANRDDRFKHYMLGCRLLGKADNMLVIFDEAEDVFVGDHWTHISHHAPRHKGWTNRLLESVKIPTIWISNSLDCIDPAYVRRFDYVLEMQTPPRSVRLRLAREVTDGLPVTPMLIERAAESVDFTPSDADRLRRILPRALGRGIAPDDAFTQLVTCRPGGISREQLAPRRSVELPYRLEWVNAQVDLSALIGLHKRGTGTLAFSGPPGTGKTELARHIATALDRPLHIKKASDLLGPYVGQTEQQIAHAFRTARQDRAVLLLDEADSFLRDRALAGRSWEVTQVNELLAQLDGYAGLAILTTNFTDTLDHALLRRMDVKLNFGYLRPDDAWAAFTAVLEACGGRVPAENSALQAQVRGLRELAFGDFVAATRGLGLATETISADQLFGAISEEVRLKGGSRRAIGFACA
jgi:transitional endoplasmic reticulum ATPase